MVSSSLCMQSYFKPTRAWNTGEKKSLIRRRVMVHLSSSPTSEYLILDLLGVRKSLTLEQVVGLLPELS